MARGNRKTKRQARMKKMSEKRRNNASNVSQTEENVELPEQTNRSFSADISKKDLTEAGCSSTEMSSANNIVEAEKVHNTIETNSSNDYGTNNSTNTFLPTGRRIIDMGYLFKTIISHKHNPSFSCSFTDMNIVKETKKGFISTFTLKCTVCESVLELCTDDADKELDVNSAAVSGAIRTGGGHTQLSKMATMLNIPGMSEDLFTNSQKK